MTGIPCQETCTSHFVLFIQLAYKSKFQPKDCLNTEKCKYQFFESLFLKCEHLKQVYYFIFSPANVHLFKFSNRYTRKRCEICSKLTTKHQNNVIDVVLMFLLLTIWTYFTPFCSVSIVNFEEVDVIWVATYNLLVQLHICHAFVCFKFCKNKFYVTNFLLSFQMIWSSCEFGRYLLKQCYKSCKKGSYKYHIFTY